MVPLPTVMPSAAYHAHWFTIAHHRDSRYEAPGSPSVAARIRELLEAAGLGCAADGARGWDHGVFVPMMLMFPEADVPQHGQRA